MKRIICILACLFCVSMCFAGGSTGTWGDTGHWYDGIVRNWNMIAAGFAGW